METDMYVLGVDIPDSDYSTRGCAETFGRKILQQIAERDDTLVAMRAAIAFRFAERVLWEDLSRA